MKTLIFDQKNYSLNQCEDIWCWFRESKIGEFTHYYKHVIFHCEDGFFAVDSELCIENKNIEKLYSVSV